MQETQVWYLDWEGPLEEKMATHSSILAGEIPWTEESGELQSLGSQTVGYHWAHMHNDISFSGHTRTKSNYSDCTENQGSHSKGVRKEQWYEPRTRGGDSQLYLREDPKATVLWNQH